MSEANFLMNKPKESCYICGRTNNSLFSLPKDNSLKLKWFEFCGITQNLFEQSNSKINLCCIHFNSEDININTKKGSRKHLKRGAVPLLNGITENKRTRKSTYRYCFLCGAIEPDVSLHGFPKDSSQAWLEFCGVDSGSIKKHSALCGRHFTPNSFKNDPKSGLVPRLRAGAIPTIHFELIPDINDSIGAGSSQSQQHETQEVVYTPTISDSIGAGSSQSQQHETQEVVYTPTTSDSIEAGCSQSQQHETQEVGYTPTISDSIEAGCSQSQQHETQEVGCTPTTNRSIIRYSGDIKTPDFATPRRAVKNFRKIRRDLLESRKKVKVLQVDNRRLKLKLKTYKELIADLAKRNLISDGAAEHFMVSMPQSLHQMIRREMSGKTRKIAPELRAFALTLHFYSPRAYQYVRKHYHKALPSISTLRRWAAILDGRPGFTAEAFKAIALKTEEREKILCNLVLDEMSIKEALSYNKQNNRVYGYEDLGTGLIEEDADSLPTAKYALVFCIVNLKEGWKLPIGYFLIRSLTGKERSHLIKMALSMLEDVRCDIRSMTFDGASTNLTACVALGANFEVESKEFQPWFFHPTTQHKVYLFPDPCHMVKLVRNTFAEKGPLFDQQGREINWKYIKNLHALEEKSGLRFATRLTNKHVIFKNNKMNVRLATQTLSHSVYAALTYLAKETKLPQFKDSSGTANFCAVFNNIFDILNCRSRFSKNRMNVPINVENCNIIKRICEVCIVYMKNLEMLVTEKSDEHNEIKIRKKVIHTPRRTGFIGLISCLTNIFELYNDVINTPEYGMSYILTYRLLQDHIENFFSAIRSRGGFCNNPTAEQFEKAYIRLLLHHEIREGELGNCAMSDITILCASNHSYSKANPVCNLDMEDEKFDTDDNLPEDFIENLCDLQPYVEDVVRYIAGFIVRKLIRRKVCAVCKPHLLASQGEQSALIRIKSKGGLTEASKDVVKICTLAERIFRQSKHSNNLADPKIAARVALRTHIAAAEEVFTDPSFLQHITQQDFLDNHKTSLIKLIAETYVSIRIAHEIRKSNQKNEYIRQKLNKLTLFRGQ